MSRHFYLALSLIFAAFAAYETWLNFHLRRVNNTVAEVCLRPSTVPPVSTQAVFVLSREAL